MTRLKKYWSAESHSHTDAQYQLIQILSGNIFQAGEEEHFQAGLTLQRSLYDQAQQWSDDENVAPVREMFRSPDCYGYLVAWYSPFKNFDIYLSGTYTGPMLTQHMAGSGTDTDVAVRTPSFWDIGCKVSYEFTIMGVCQLNVHAGVKNIFNAYQKDFDRGEMRDRIII